MAYFEGEVPVVSTGNYGNNGWNDWSWIIGLAVVGGIFGNGGFGFGGNNRGNHRRDHGRNSSRDEGRGKEAPGQHERHCGLRGAVCRCGQLCSHRRAGVPPQTVLKPEMLTGTTGF